MVRQYGAFLGYIKKVKNTFWGIPEKNMGIAGLSGKRDLISMLGDSRFCSQP